MKEFLNYYYYLLPNKIKKVQNNYFFQIKNYYFGFYQYNGNIDELPSLFSLSNYLSYQDRKVNKIILNKEGNIATKKNNSYYILILLENNSNDIISLNNIITFPSININFPSLNRTNWYYLWIMKVDYLEEVRKNLKKEDSLLYNSLPYYIGLTENAISCLKYSNISNNHIAICHKRVIYKEGIRDFYNPINLIIDYKVRDLAEYYKSLFFNGKIDIKEIINSLKRIKMNDNDMFYFYIRMLYPSYYFDMVDEVLKDNIKVEELLNITKLSDTYEYLLYEIYLLFNLGNINVEWITKKFAN